jgi:hypothetical protein
MTAARPSRRAAQRLAASHVAERDSIPTLRSDLERMLTEYVLSGVDDGTWETIRPVHHEVMRRSQLTGADSFRKHLGVVAKYLAYRHEQSLGIGITAAFSAVEIDHYYLHGLTGSVTTCNDYRSRLLNLARRVNPDPNAPVKTPAFGHSVVRPGYSAAEEAAIRRVALRQRTPRIRRQLCAIVGLCGGAGLDATDLRHLRGRDIIDHGDSGIEVRIPQGRVRTTWVRHTHEDLVRIGIDGLPAHALVIGQRENRRNVANQIVVQAELTDVDHLDVCRLRSTWLSWLLTHPVPLQVILDAAGLKTARTLGELVDYLTADPDHNRPDARAELRGTPS